MNIMVRTIQVIIPIITDPIPAATAEVQAMVVEQVLMGVGAVVEMEAVGVATSA